jgi:hypothetical protein
MFFTVPALPAQTQSQPARVLVRAVHGSATSSLDGNWQPVRENANLAPGTTVKTGPDTTLDLFLPDSRTVLRLMPGSVLRFDRLDRMASGDLEFTRTRVSLLSGSLIGSQHKLVRPSEFEVVLPDGVAKIVGTEYSARADGTVACLSGTVSVVYHPPGNGAAVDVSVPAGYSSDPATGKTAAISPADLRIITPDVQAVRNNDMAYSPREGHEVEYNHCDDKMSPTHGHGDGDGHGEGHGDGDGNGEGHDGDGHGNGNGGDHR